MKLAILFALVLSPSFSFAEDYVCRVTSIVPVGGVSQTFRNYADVTVEACAPKTIGSIDHPSFSVHEAKMPIIESAMATGTTVTLTTKEPVAYGGVATAVNGQPAQALRSESAQFFVYDDVNSKSLALQILDSNGIKRIPSESQSQGKVIKTCSRELVITLGNVVISVLDEGPRFSYKTLHPASQEVRIEYSKRSIDDEGRVLTSAELQKLKPIANVTSRLRVKGERLSTGLPAMITLDLKSGALNLHE